MMQQYCSCDNWKIVRNKKVYYLKPDHQSRVNDWIYTISFVDQIVKTRGEKKD